MKILKKLIITTPLLMGTILVANIAHASVISSTRNSENTNSSKLLSSNKIADNDTILRLSENTYVHGKMTIYNVSNLENPVINLDTDNNTLAKKARDIRKGEAIKPLEVTNRYVRNTAPPVQVIVLSTGTYSDGQWPVGGNRWYFSDFAYQSRPLKTDATSLYFVTDTIMRAGDSADWTATYKDGKGVESDGQGVVIPAGHENINSVTPKVGKSLACWDWSPKEVTHYMVCNPNP